MNIKLIFADTHGYLLIFVVSFYYVYYIIEAIMISAISHFLAILAFLSGAFIVITALALAAARLGNKKLLNGLRRIVSPIWLEFVFVVSLVSSLGSLFYSEVAGFPPCLLCWYQRIFMYPQPFIAYLALVRNQRLFIRPYLLLLSFVGLGIALYHNAIQWLPHLFPDVPCDARGVSCARIYPIAFSWITIPMMSAVAFLLLLTILFVYAKNSKKR